MIIDILVVIFSLSCAFVWARYAIQTIIAERTSSGSATRLAKGTNLEFMKVRETLDSASEREEYLRSAESLRYDLLAVSYFLRATPTGAMRPYSRDEKLLAIDFRVMQSLCAIGRFVCPPMARFALREMIAVLTHFAELADERMTTQASQWA